MSYGRVLVKLRNGSEEIAELLDFTTIPVPIRDGKVGEEPKTRTFVYGILETESGEFLARSLNEFTRLQKEVETEENEQPD